jgi:hypothetical protein
VRFLARYQCPADRLQEYNEDNLLQQLISDPSLLLTHITISDFLAKSELLFVNTSTADVTAISLGDAYVGDVI